MAITLSVLIFLASILLIGVVLIQKSKGGGLAASASNYNQFMGVKKTTDFVEKATWGLAIFICVLSIATPFISKPTIVSANKKIKIEIVIAILSNSYSLFFTVSLSTSFRKKRIWSAK